MLFCNKIQFILRYGTGATFSKLLRNIFGRFPFLKRMHVFESSLQKSLEDLPGKMLGKDAFLKLLWKDLWKKILENMLESTNLVSQKKPV